MKIFWMAGAAALLLAGEAFAGSYDEALNGDLSNDWLNPTVFVLDPGGNSLTATSVSGDREYVTFSIPAGFLFQTMTLDAYSAASGVSFIGIESGTTFTPPDTTTEADLLGYTHFGQSQVGADVLGEMGTAFGATGFTPPLPAGDYTLWIQETGPSARTYTFTLDVVAVPEPATMFLLGAGLGGIAVICRRRVR